MVVYHILQNIESYSFLFHLFNQLWEIINLCLDRFFLFFSHLSVIENVVRINDGRLIKILG